MTREATVARLLISWGAKNHNALERLMWRLEANHLGAQLKEAIEYTKVCNERFTSGIEMTIRLLEQLRDDPRTPHESPS
jgi:hypothetical protein